MVGIGMDLTPQKTNPATLELLQVSVQALDLVVTPAKVVHGLISAFLVGGMGWGGRDMRKKNADALHPSNKP